MSDLHKILTKALNDPKFAATLKENPEQAMKEAGVTSTPQKVAALRDSIESLTKANQYFGGEKPY
jgi:hypothetical protein